MMQLWAWTPLFAAGTFVYKVSRATAKRKQHFLWSLKSLVDSKIKWNDVAHFPGVTGTIECTYVRIICPNKENAIVLFFIIILSYTQNIYIKFKKKMRQGSPRKPIRLVYRNTFKIMFPNRPFYRYGGHIECIRFKEYYGMPRGHSLGIYARFSGKKRTWMHISREKGDRYDIQRRYNNLFLGKHLT